MSMVMEIVTDYVGDIAITSDTCILRLVDLLRNQM
jgi:hypothetical protein